MQTRQAAKEHECSLCKRPIHEGEEYLRERMTPWKGVDNEVFYTYKAHEQCHEKWEEVAADFDYRLPMSTSEWKYAIGETT